MKRYAVIYRAVMPPIPPSWWNGLDGGEQYTPKMERLEIPIVRQEGRSFLCMMPEGEERWFHEDQVSEIHSDFDMGLLPLSEKDLQWIEMKNEVCEICRKIFGIPPEDIL